MQTNTFVIQIGQNKVVITNCNGDNPDVAELMRMASTIHTEITITAPQTPNAVQALARLLEHNGSKFPERLAALSKPLDDCGISLPLANRLQNAGYTFVWQVARHPEGELLKIKRIGPKQLREFQEKALGVEGLTLGMDLSSMTSLLPQP